MGEHLRRAKFCETLINIESRYGLEHWNLCEDKEKNMVTAIHKSTFVKEICLHNLKAFDIASAATQSHTELNEQANVEFKMGLASSAV